MSVEEGAQLDAITTPLPWQRAAWERLAATADEGRLPHALLISGGEGSGRRRFVTALSRLLLCQAPLHGTNCGECKTCALSQTRGHSDWRWVSPESKSRSIGIDQVREVIRFTAQTSALGQYKILVLCPADAMTLAAANAFLKCLEEPAADTVILLVTRSPSAVPATIRSRCQHLHLPGPDPGAAEAWLSLVTGDEALARRALAAADGMPLTADILLQSDDALQAAEERQALLSDLFAGRGNAAEAARMLSALDAEDAVKTLRARLHQYLRQLPTARLREPRARALLALDNRLRELQRSLAGGATPQRELLAATLVAQLDGILGADAAGC